MKVGVAKHKQKKKKKKKTQKNTRGFQQPPRDPANVPPRDPANVTAMFDRYDCINSKKKKWTLAIFRPQYQTMALNEGFIKMYRACTNQQDNGDAAENISQIH